MGGKVIAVILYYFSVIVKKDFLVLGVMRFVIHIEIMINVLKNVQVKLFLMNIHKTALDAHL